MTIALDMMITKNLINRIDSIINKLNSRRNTHKNYHPRLILSLGDMLIDIHRHRRQLEPTPW